MIVCSSKTTQLIEVPLWPRDQAIMLANKLWAGMTRKGISEVNLTDVHSVFCLWHSILRGTKSGHLGYSQHLAAVRLKATSKHLRTRAGPVLCPGLQDFFCLRKTSYFLETLVAKFCYFNQTLLTVSHIYDHFSHNFLSQNEMLILHLSCLFKCIVCIWKAEMYNNLLSALSLPRCPQLSQDAQTQSRSPRCEARSSAVEL